MNRTVRLLGPLGFCVLATTLSGCGDQVTDPDRLAGSAEAEAVLRSADALPSLTGLIDRVEAGADDATRASFHRARELWLDGAAAPGPQGRYQRHLAVSRATPGLVRLVPAADWQAARADLDGWIGTVDGMLRHLTLPDVDRRIRAARGHLARADASSDTRFRVRLIMLAAAELVETTPRHVATALLADAQTALDSLEVGRLERDRRLRRARRLKDWGDRAVGEEAYLLAIQRAYYALQLLEGR